MIMFNGGKVSIQYNSCKGSHVYNVDRHNMYNSITMNTKKYHNDRNVCVCSVYQVIDAQYILEEDDDCLIHSYMISHHC